jgi:hypothetical protein
VYKLSLFSLLLGTILSLSLNADLFDISSESSTSESDFEFEEISLSSYQEARARAASELGLIRTTFKFTDEEITKQLVKYPSKVDFADAVIAALKSFREDSSDEESLLHLIIEDIGAKAAANHAQRLLNKPSTKLRLLCEDQDVLPLTTEHVQRFWIFYLSMDESDLGDHTFWAEVDRQGIEPTKNFGFN